MLYSGDVTETSRLRPQPGYSKAPQEERQPLEGSVSEKVQVSFGQRVGPLLEPETAVPEKAYTTDV
jgi:hypothetical protein